MMARQSVQVAVLGAGPGGYAAAFYAADLGLSVALVDEEPNPGGVCVYRGCIPSKALLHVAKLVEEAKHAETWGYQFRFPNSRHPQAPRIQATRRRQVDSRGRAGRAPTENRLRPGQGHADGTRVHGGGRRRRRDDDCL